MRIDALGLEAFVAIAERGSFQKAADALLITQTALTRRLQNFEALLGVKLVERTTRSVALSQIGRDFLPQARRSLSELASALTEIPFGCSPTISRARSVWTAVLSVLPESVTRSVNLGRARLGNRITASAARCTTFLRRMPRLARFVVQPP